MVNRKKIESAISRKMVKSANKMSKKVSGITFRAKSMQMKGRARGVQTGSLTDFNTSTGTNPHQKVVKAVKRVNKTRFRRKVRRN